MSMSYTLSLTSCSIFLLSLRPTFCTTLFPYTALFRSGAQGDRRDPAERRPQVGRGDRLLDGAERLQPQPGRAAGAGGGGVTTTRSEEHTSELQSRENLVCRLLLEKKKDAVASKRLSRL